MARNAKSCHGHRSNICHDLETTEKRYAGNSWSVYLHNCLLMMWKKKGHGQAGKSVENTKLFMLAETKDDVELNQNLKQVEK